MDKVAFKKDLCRNNKKGGCLWPGKCQSHGMNYEL